MTMELSLELCRLEDIPEGGSKGVALDPESVYADVLLVRREGRVYAYRNSCPHTGAPMEWQPDQFLDYRDHYIQCGIHAALFRVEDGFCVQGPCARQSLTPLAVVVREGRVLALEDPRRKRSERR